jgi:hypothetical protein
LLSLWIFQFWMFYTNGISPCTTFCVWLPSPGLVFKVHPCSFIKQLFLLWLSKISLYGYSTFWLIIHQLIGVLAHFVLV